MVHQKNHHLAKFEISLLKYNIIKTLRYYYKIETYTLKKIETIGCILLPVKLQYSSFLRKIQIGNYSTQNCA